MEEGRPPFDTFAKSVFTGMGSNLMNCGHQRIPTTQVGQRSHQPKVATIHMDYFGVSFANNAQKALDLGKHPKISWQLRKSVPYRGFHEARA